MPVIRLLGRLPVDGNGSPAATRLPKAEMAKMLASKNLYLWAMAMWDKEKIANKMAVQYMFSLYTPRKSSLRRVVWMNHLLGTIVAPESYTGAQQFNALRGYLFEMERQQRLEKKRGTRRGH